MTESRIGRGRERRGFAPLSQTGVNTATRAPGFSYRGVGQAESDIGWGGARNRSDRVTFNLSPGQVELLIAATEFALFIGAPFNRWITIHWQKAGLTDELAAGAVTAFLKRAGDAVRYWGGTFAAAWAREDGFDRKGEPKGSHVHILAHVSAGLLGRFKRAQMGWLKALRLSPRHNGGTIEGKPIMGSLATVGQSSDLYAVNLWTVAGYTVKGADQAVLDRAGIDRQHVAGGTITGKRAGTTQNVGRGEWKRAGWQPRLLVKASVVAAGDDPDAARSHGGGTSRLPQGRTPRLPQGRTLTSPYGRA